MKTTALILTVLAASAQAFAPANPSARITTMRLATEDTDFDAPVERAAAVGNVVQADKPSVFGVPVPSFIAKAFGVRLPYGDAAASEKDMLMEMDEECYLGKNGDLEECADFDPPVAP